MLANTELHCPKSRDQDGPSATELDFTGRDSVDCKVNAGKAPKLLRGEKSALPRCPQDSLPFGAPPKMYAEFSALQFVSEI